MMKKLISLSLALMLLIGMAAVAAAEEEPRIISLNIGGITFAPGAPITVRWQISSLPEGWKAILHPAEGINTISVTELSGSKSFTAPMEPDTYAFVMSLADATGNIRGEAKQCRFKVTAPATEAPATEAPATDAPATEAPATDAPATEAPATDAPATDAPATEAPATDAPATEAPATEAPATDAPATEAPATEAPQIVMLGIGENGHGEPRVHAGAPMAVAWKISHLPTGWKATLHLPTGGQINITELSGSKSFSAPTALAVHKVTMILTSPEGVEATELSCSFIVVAAPIVTATPAPATQAPATQAPATQAPATQAPATQAPATQAPATQAPATQAPAVQKPAQPAAKPAMKKAVKRAPQKSALSMAINASFADGMELPLSLTSIAANKYDPQHILVQLDDMEQPVTFKWSDKLTQEMRRRGFKLLVIKIGAGENAPAFILTRDMLDTSSVLTLEPVSADKLPEGVQPIFPAFRPVFDKMNGLLVRYPMMDDAKVITISTENIVEDSSAMSVRLKNGMFVDVPVPGDYIVAVVSK